MKVGNIVGGLEVIDVKRVNKMNVIQFTKAIAEYIEQGYKLDVHSARQIGLVLQVDVYKLEGVVSEDSTPVISGTSVSENESKDGNVDESTLLVNGVEVKGFLPEDVIVVKEDATVAVVDELDSEQPNETTIDALQEPTDGLEVVGSTDNLAEEVKQPLGTGDVSEQNDVAVQKKTRAKKTT